MSAKADPQPRRQRDGSFPSVRTIGIERELFADSYHAILVRPWWRFVLLAGVAFLALNALFALLYILEPGSVTGARARSFEDAFYFSVQTLATIGYGGMAPATRWAHAVVTIEAFTGTLCVALLTGMTFAKFARPRGRIMFSARVAAAPRHGKMHLMFRMANRRQNLVVEAQLRVVVLVVEHTPEGETFRRALDLRLVRERTPLFALSWTALHAIDENSPFYGDGALDRLRAQGAELYLSFTGVDETQMQAIHTRHRYELDDIAWNSRFADIMTVLEDGSRVIDYRHFHTVVPIAAPAQLRVQEQ